MEQKILIYLCMNAIFSKNMQNTETKINENLTVYFCRCGKFKYGQQLSIQYLVHVLFTIEMLVFILQLKKFP